MTRSDLLAELSRHGQDLTGAHVLTDEQLAEWLHAVQDDTTAHEENPVEYAAGSTVLLSIAQSEQMTSVHPAIAALRADPDMVGKLIEASNQDLAFLPQGTEIKICPFSSVGAMKVGIILSADYQGIEAIPDVIPEGGHYPVGHLSDTVAEVRSALLWFFQLMTDRKVMKAYAAYKGAKNGKHVVIRQFWGPEVLECGNQLKISECYAVVCQGGNP